ncbi:MAG: hypothetical protein ACI9XJ_000655, partial [Marivirga sp.]
ATPAKTIGSRVLLAAAMPMTILAVDSIPSFAPSIAARNQLLLIT